MISEPDQIYIYTVHVKTGRGPEDIIDELTYSVWNVLRNEFDDLDPHRWAMLSRAFKGVFKNRVAFYQGCGAEGCWAGQKEALFSHKEAEPLPPREPAVAATLYIFEIRQHSERFVESLSKMTLRLFRDVLKGSPMKKREVRDWVFLAIRRTLLNYLFQNDRCIDCPVRKGAADRRIWRDQDKKWRLGVGKLEKADE